jgi:hypothetical protein
MQNRPAGLVRPKVFARLAVQGVERAVEGADQHFLLRDDRLNAAHEPLVGK